jgi:hypothetical protein
VNTKRAMAIIAGVVLTLCALVTQPHEFIIKPAQLQIESDAKLPFSILATHVFMIGEEVAPIDVKENHTLETLDGVVTLDRKGTAVLAAHLQEAIETIKPKIPAAAAKDYDVLSLKATLVFSVQ